MTTIGSDQRQVYYLTILYRVYKLALRRKFCKVCYCFRVVVICFIVSGWLLAILLFQGVC